MIPIKRLAPPARLLPVTLACAFASVPASAAEFVTTYTSTNVFAGSAIRANLAITASDTLNSRGGYDIQSMSGNVNGTSISGLVVNPSQPDTASQSIFTYDNIYYGGAYPFDSTGILFTTSDGKLYNFWANTSTSYQLKSTSGLNSQTTVDNSTGYIGSTPPAAVVQPDHPSGSTILTFEEVPPYFENQVSTQGYTFTSAGNCCAYAWSQDPTARNGWEYLMYTRHAETMRAVDGSLFSVSSFDAAIGAYAKYSEYLLLLTGLRADGSTVTTNISIGSSYQSFTLSGFDNLSALTFSHPTNDPGMYVKIDNLAVSAAVPEPSTWALLLLGFGLVGGSLRRRRQGSLIQQVG
ncbi:PEPxxWA-CTERM sorting domain-containing protein [Sphingomonas glaciei]|uniref:PEPxxWA-CTERM sorting domain-containing protein n=1 Tax=Sphingomonas glaciei TaxID=2938948 RepID=A0ABY5MY20_9SPHN|nr:PEPxxWA-CTERM sorting domain-containing protein [Sphingomonas glaciei]UUR08894.1 PEPxxWA-CTERM sorting domain-containing protein [Sphingomonas glaciei]